MSIVLFDTHAFVKRLTAAGMPEPQAEVLAETHARLIDERLATKSDLEDVSTKADVSDAKVEILKWVAGMIGFQTLALLGAIVALVKVFH